MKLVKLSFLIAFLSILLSCGNKKLNGNYEIYSSTETSDLQIAYVDDHDYAFVVIEEQILAVGQNDDFIIVKRHPPEFKNVDYFYIIPLKNKISPSYEKNIIGPMAESTFVEKRIQLGIPASLSFNVLDK